MTSGRRVALILALGVGLVAMHCLTLLMPASGVMHMAAEHSTSVMSTSGAPAAQPVPMSSCSGHACLAARGAETATPMATPSVTAGLVIAATTRVVARRPAADLLGSQRPPPRSGPCSPLCVWRV